MQHIVMLKFDKKQDESTLGSIVSSIYDELRDEYKVIDSYKYHTNCLDLDPNMDLVIFVDIPKGQELSKYIKHPRHVDFLNRMKEIGLASKAAIDIEI